MCFILTLSAPNFRRHLSSAFFFFFLLLFFYFNKLSLGKTFICKVERLNVKQRRSRLSRLIWIYVVCKSLLLPPVAVKELKEQDIIIKSHAYLYSSGICLEFHTKCHNSEGR